MADKKAEWSDYAYDNDSISKRLGIDKDEVQKLKKEAEKRSKETSEGVAQKQPDFGVGIGGSIDINDLKNSALRVGIKVPGLGIQIDTNGEGSIDIVNLIRVETVRIKCFYIQRFYFAGQFLYSDIQKVDSEECNEPEPTPEPTPEPGQEPQPPNPITKWPPDPKGGSSTKPLSVLVAYKGFTSIIHTGDQTNNRYVAENSSSITNVDLKKRLVYYKKNGIDIVSGFTGVTIDGSYYTHFNLSRFIHAANRSVQEFWIDAADKTLLYVSGSEIGILNYLDTLEYQFQSQLTLTLDINNGSASYSQNSKSYNYSRESPPGFFNRDYSWQSVDHRGSYLGNYHFYQENEYRRATVVDVVFIEYHVNQPIKNPPISFPKPEKDMNEDCCKLLKKLAKYQGLGQKISPINVKDNKIEEKGNKDENFPMKIPKRWIDRDAKPKDDYEVQNMRHLILSVGIMLDRFEELFNPAGKDNGFPLKKPEEGLWKWLPGDGGDYEAPDPDYDPKKSKNDGKIKNKKLKIETYLDLFRYFLESQIRLELLFPIAQIRDSEISKRLIYPKAPGTIKINDLIQFQELMLLFINKTLGDPSGAVIIKDADPTQEGAQPITIENFDISDMLRKLLRFSVDINSDIDLTNNFSKRTLYQLLSAMQVLVKNHEMTEAIFEDLGMKEEQSFVPVKFFADPYAGAWKSGEGFDPTKVKVENSEAAIEANLEAFLQEKEVEVKVSRRAKDETTDIRDLLAQIGRYAAELAAMGKIPNNPEAIQQAIDKARFELQTESALRRTDVRQASAAGRVRTKRNKPKGKQR